MEDFAILGPIWGTFSEFLKLFKIYFPQVCSCALPFRGPESALLQTWHNAIPNRFKCSTNLFYGRWDGGGGGGASYEQPSLVESEWVNIPQVSHHPHALPVYHTFWSVSLFSRVRHFCSSTRVRLYKNSLTHVRPQHDVSWRKTKIKQL